MDARDLKVFEAVARHSGMNRAARELNTVQSNVTMRIRQLEAELGISLFERHTKGMRLTQAGTRLLPHAIGVQAALANAKRAVIDDGTPKGALVIGSLESAAAIHLSSMLSPYLAAYPDVDVSLRTGTTADLLEQVLNCNIEGAFVYGPLEHAELVTETIFEDELVILSAPHITDLSAMSGADTKMIVLRSGCLYRKRLEALLAREGLEGLRLLEFGTLEAIFGCISAGLGVTLLPKGLVNPAWHREKVRIHDVSGPMGRVETLFIRRRGAFVSSALSSFLKSVRNSKGSSVSH